jgi:hypothetical protein
MKQMSSRDLRARAWSFRADNRQLVRLRLGASDYLMTDAEATALSAELLAAVRQSEQARVSNGHARSH